MRVTGLGVLWERRKGNRLTTAKSATVALFIDLFFAGRELGRVDGDQFADFHRAIAAGVTAGERRNPAVLSLQIMNSALGALPHLVINRAERFLKFLAVVKVLILRAPIQAPHVDPTTGATPDAETRKPYQPENRHDYPAHNHGEWKSAAGI